MRNPKYFAKDDYMRHILVSEMLYLDLSHECHFMSLSYSFDTISRLMGVSEYGSNFFLNFLGLGHNLLLFKIY